MGYPLASTLLLALWVCLLIATWEDSSGVAVNVAGTLIATLVLYLPAAFCVGLMLRCAECLGDWWRYFR